MPNNNKERGFEDVNISLGLIDPEWFMLYTVAGGIVVHASATGPSLPGLNAFKPPQL